MHVAFLFQGIKGCFALQKVHLGMLPSVEGRGQLCRRKRGKAGRRPWGPRCEQGGSSYALGRALLAATTTRMDVHVDPG